MSFTRQIGLVALLAAALAAARGAQAAYNYNASDFATEVVSYDAGYMPDIDFLPPYPEMTDATRALGRPTVDTTGDKVGSFGTIPISETVPVVPCYPAFRYWELVSIGEGVSPGESGRLVLKFDHEVFDNPLNPYGRDFILFGNAMQLYSSNHPWDNRDPSQTALTQYTTSEPGRVSVSQDGVTWHALPTPNAGANPPVYGADDFAPTLGRVYDPANPDTSVGAWNQWWGQPTNPTLPLETSLTKNSFSGKTVAQVAQMYGESAGGTSFDIGGLALAVDPATGMKWFQYVKIENPYNSNKAPEIDAVSDVFARRPGDANLDGVVDVGDLGILATNYGLTNKTWAAGDFNGDGAVDIGDLGILATNYGLTNGEYAPPGGGGPPPVPEPTTLLLLAVGGCFARRFHHKGTKTQRNRMQQKKMA